MDVIGGGPGSESDLNRGIGAAFGSAGGLEVDGGEDCLADFDGDCISQSLDIEKKMPNVHLRSVSGGERGWQIDFDSPVSRSLLVGRIGVESQPRASSADRYDGEFHPGRCLSEQR